MPNYTHTYIHTYVQTYTHTCLTEFKIEDIERYYPTVKCRGRKLSELNSIMQKKRLKMLKCAWKFVLSFTLTVYKSVSAFLLKTRKSERGFRNRSIPCEREIERSGYANVRVGLLQCYRKIKLIKINRIY